MSCDRLERMSDLLLSALAPEESRSLEAHAASCQECCEELWALRATVDSFVEWPADVLHPSESLWERLARRISVESGSEVVRDDQESWAEPAWVEVAPGISCSILAMDEERSLVSMLVRLAPNTDYPPHTHAACEELHLLDGELWIDDRKLHPGDYNRAEPGSSDARVWSETGCTCVLVTSTLDVLH